MYYNGNQTVTHGQHVACGSLFEYHCLNDYTIISHNIYHYVCFTDETFLQNFRR